MIIVDVIAIWLSWGLIWTLYCIASTLIHPIHRKGFDLDKFTTWRNMVISTVGWPYSMYQNLKALHAQAKEWERRNEQQIQTKG